jgi:Asp-tRNA(Asn)/Glu-tRNA(Gln) amidotransferase C subunit
LGEVKHIEINPKINQLLQKPTWSVASLMPPLLTQGRQRTGQEKDKSAAPAADSSSIVGREKLHHLLRLSSLPPPRDAEEEGQMLQTLAQQIHFVREIQKVDTTGVEPLVAIRDETSEARQETMITKASLAEYIALEQRRGKNGTIRRKKDVEVKPAATDRTDRAQNNLGQWDPEEVDDAVAGPFRLGDDEQHESDKKRGRYFFVQRTPKQKKDGTGGQG